MKRPYKISLGFLVLFAIVGAVILFAAKAASPYVSVNTSSGTLANNACPVTDGSGNAYVRFGQSCSGGGTNGFMVGLGAGGWGPGGASDAVGAAKYIRFDSITSESVTDFTSLGAKIDMDFSVDLTLNPANYNTGGVSAIDAAKWASAALSTYQSKGCTTATCPMIEVLNEPGGGWFWGSGATSSTNEAVYANLIKATYSTFQAAYGTGAPIILASYDGGSDSSVTWGAGDGTKNNTGWWSSSMSQYVGGVTIHPYGGTSNTTQSALGNRAQVTEAHTNTGKPVYVTEVGWPTAVGQSPTGDSLQWTEQQQCSNIYNFLTWSKSTGYVNAVFIYGYRNADDTHNAQYGIEKHDGTKKPAYSAMQALTQGKTYSC